MVMHKMDRDGNYFCTSGGYCEYYVGEYMFQSNDWFYDYRSGLVYGSHLRW